MIRYSLRCDKGHAFEGWFPSAAGFDAQQAQGLVACSLCGSTQVDKALMAPAVPAKSRGDTAPDIAAEQPLSAPANPMEEALSKLRAHVEANSDYVGMSFASEARAMHEGAAPKRAIHGEARPEEARALIEEGVPVAPLPFLPRQKTN